jgi:hypothetical protein
MGKLDAVVGDERAACAVSALNEVNKADDASVRIFMARLARV